MQTPTFFSLVLSKNGWDDPPIILAILAVFLFVTCPFIEMQNVSAIQLQTIETSAVQGALQQAVNSGTLTQKQATAIAKRLEKNPQVLERILKA